MREKEVYVYYTPTDEAFRPFKYTLEMAANKADYQPNVADWPGWEDVAKNWNPTNLSKLGSYAFAIQELFKGRFSTLVDPDSDTGGWGFNLNDDAYWRYEDPVSHKKVPIHSLFANEIQKDQLRTRPFFSKDLNHPELYFDQTVSISPALQEKILANEMPALTFAAGHRGVKEVKFERNVDIRQIYLVDPGAPWPGDRPRHEWRHSDIYAVSYPYLTGLYDEWANKIQGVAP